MSELPKLKALSPDDAHQLGLFLLRSGYTEEGRHRLWDRSLPPASSQVKGLLLDVAGPATPLATLVRLFELGLRVEASDVEQAIPGRPLEACLESGLLQRNGDQLVGAFRIDTVHRKLLVCDRFQANQAVLEAVVGSSGVAARMLDATPRTPFARALDVCAGGGIQSLFLADHCERVVAIDLNPRALDIAFFNMRLNGIDNVEFHLGNRLEPVAGATFDLIVCNPPFYISPSRRTLYSDNEMELDEFCRCIVREAAGHLDAGGQLHALVEWVEIEGQTTWERPAAWFEGLGCDVWLMRDYQNDVPSYVRKRLIEKTPADRKTAGEWLDFFAQHKVTRVHGGAVALRRRQGKTWTAFDGFDRRVNGGRGEYVSEGFAVRDFLSEHETNESLLPERFAVSPHLRIEEHFRPDGGEWATDFVRVRLAGAVVVSAKTTNSMARVLRLLDGDRTLEQAIRKSRDLENGEPIPRLDAYLDTARRLLCRGLILPRGN